MGIDAVERNRYRMTLIFSAITRRQARPKEDLCGDCLFGQTVS